MHCGPCHVLNAGTHRDAIRHGVLADEFSGLQGRLDMDRQCLLDGIDGGVGIFPNDNQPTLIAEIECDCQHRSKGDQE